MDKSFLPLIAGLVAGGITFARMLKTRQENDCPS